ncbi:MAG: hypothetical protein HY659_04480 [Rhizobiales bacterium]|nr:hypothetical protein [Hyphomicrobiales bacterium]
MLRIALALIGLVVAFPALGEPMNASEARRFVVGKLFNFTCFEGTRGVGRVHADGSVVGTIQFRGDGPVRHASLPSGTLLAKGENVCAQVRGMPFQPCFNLQKTDDYSFRGSLSGLGFAYCDFTRRPRLEYASARAKVKHDKPLSLLRPTIAATGRD